MYYLFERALQRVRRNKKRYFLLILQVTVGMSMLSLSLNMILNYQYQMARIENKISHPYATISLSTKSNVPVSIVDKIKTDWPDKMISYYYQFDTPLIYDNEKVNIIFVDDGFYETILGIDDSSYSGKKKYYANSKAVNALLTDVINHPELQDFYDLHNQVYFGAPIDNYVSLDDENLRCSSLLTGILYETDSIYIPSFKDTVILPLAVKGDIPCSLFIAIPFEIGEEESVNQLASSVYEELVFSLGNPNFQIRNYYNEMQGIIGRNSVMAKMLFAVAAFIFIIVFFGLIGLLLVFLNQRKREISVCIMCGAKQKQIMKEVFFEVYFVLSIGTIIGSPLSSIFLPSFDGLGLETYWTFMPFVYCILLSFFISFLIVLSLVREIYSISPISVLKDL